MGRLYCMHMTPIDENCDECPPAVDIWEAARAWQAFRDWLNGTPEQWQAHSMAALERGYAMREHKR